MHTVFNQECFLEEPLKVLLVVWGLLLIESESQVFSGCAEVESFFLSYYSEMLRTSPSEHFNFLHIIKL